jgi:hypothetical protein
LRENVPEYGSTLHFTPLQLGSSLALVYLTCGGSLQATEPEPLSSRVSAEVLRIDALEQIVKSQQTYTLQREFYKAIGGLHYLYDDFNDRSVHFHHAVQMAGSEFSSFLFRKLEHANREKPVGREAGE